MIVLHINGSFNDNVLMIMSFNVEDNGIYRLSCFNCQSKENCNNCKTERKKTLSVTLKK